jgi:hypothetical protein
MPINQAFPWRGSRRSLTQRSIHNTNDLAFDATYKPVQL